MHIFIAPEGAIKFPMVCYGWKRGTNDGLLEEVSSFLEEICSSLEVVSASLGVVSAWLGRVCSFLEDVSSSTYHCSSGNHYGLVAEPVSGQTTIHTYLNIYKSSAIMFVLNGLLNPLTD